MNPLCFAGKYMLLELPFSSAWSKTNVAMVKRILSDYDIIPVLAHAERYTFYDKSSFSILNRLVGKGCLVQLNAGSIAGSLRLLMVNRLINEGLVHLIGSDSHNTVTRPVRIKKAVQILRIRYPEAMKQVQSCSKMMIESANWAREY
jgi:protein-tyrosine phosphatase